MALHRTETPKCPVCGSPRPEKPCYRLKSVNVFRCACGIKYIDPSLNMESQIRLYQSSETLKEVNPILESYYENAALDPRSATCRDYQRALEAVEGGVSGRSLLEVGCGAGSFLDFARQKQWKVCGIDSSDENISRLQSRGLRGITGNFLTYPIEEKFDVVVFWDVLEHLQAPGQFIARARSLLTPKGLVLIAIPNEGNLIVSLSSFFYGITGGRLKAPLGRFYVLEHTSYFTPEALRRFLEHAEMKVIDCWQTDTDLDRYRLPMHLKLILRCLFVFGSILNQRTRFLMIAQKKD